MYSLAKIQPIRQLYAASRQEMYVSKTYLLTFI